MSGGFLLTGLMSNEGHKLSEDDVKKYMDLKIENLSIQIIPLQQNNNISRIRTFGKLLQNFVHPAIFSPTLSHIAIQLTLEKNIIIIIEYGQYLTKESSKENSGLFASANSFNSSKSSRKEFNHFNYYYINKDGARLTIVPSTTLTGILSKNFPNLMKDKNCNEISKYSLIIMACNHYGISLTEFSKSIENLASLEDYEVIECEVKNKIKLSELCDYFKGEKWEANQYNVVSNNCQHFGAEIIKILKAIRIHDVDKVRSREKSVLPNCIISALWDNEEWSVINTVGRIPVIGLLYDYTLGNFVTNKTSP